MTLQEEKEELLDGNLEFDQVDLNLETENSLELDAALTEADPSLVVNEPEIHGCSSNKSMQVVVTDRSGRVYPFGSPENDIVVRHHATSMRQNKRKREDEEEEEKTQNKRWE